MGWGGVWGGVGGWVGGWVGGGVGMQGLMILVWGSLQATASPCRRPQRSQLLTVHSHEALATKATGVQLLEHCNAFLRSTWSK